MHKWHLLLFAFLAVFKPTVSFGEHSLADGQQQCCNHHSSFLLRDTRFLHGSNRYLKSMNEDRHINFKALRDIRQYDHEPREQITAKDKHGNPISLQHNGRDKPQSFKNILGKWNYEIARQSIFGVFGSRHNQNKGTRLAVYYSRDIHRSNSLNPQEVRDVNHDLLQGAKNYAARLNRNVHRTVEYRLNDLRSVKRSEPRFDTNRKSRVNSRMSGDVRVATQTRDQGARKGIVQSYRKLQFLVEIKLHDMRRVKHSEPRFNTNREHRVNSRISRDVRGTKETRDQVKKDDEARPYRDTQRTVEYKLDRLRLVARSEPRLVTTRESRMNSRISRDIGETTKIRDQKARNDVVLSHRKAQLNVENRLNSFTSDTSFEPRLNRNRENRMDSRIAQDFRETAETLDHETRNDVVRSYRNVSLMVENRIAAAIRVTRSEPRFDISRNLHSSLKYSREAMEDKQTHDLLQVRNVIIRSHKNVPRMVKSTLDGLRRVPRSETRLEDNREFRIRTLRVFKNESKHPMSITRNFRETAYYRAKSQHQNSFRTKVRENRQDDRKQTFFERRDQRLTPSVLKIDNNRILSRYDSENLRKPSNRRIGEQRYQREENAIRTRKEVSRTTENRRFIRSVILRNSLRVVSKYRRNQRINQIQQYRDENSNQPILLKQTQNIIYRRSVILGFKNNRVQNDRRIASDNIREKTERIQDRSSQQSERNDDTKRSSDGRMKFTAIVYRRPSLSEGLINRVLYERERSAHIRSDSRQQNNVRIYGSRQFRNGRVQRFRNVRSLSDDDRHSLSVNPKHVILKRAPNERKLENITPTFNNGIIVINNWRNNAVKNGHDIIGFTERRFEARGLVRVEMNRRDQRSRESTSSDYRHYMRSTLLQEKGVQVRYTLRKANDIKIHNDRTSEIEKLKEQPKKETSTTKWQYIFYTIQGLYVCAVLIHMGTEDKLRKTKKGYLGLWKFSQDTLKIE